MCLCVQILYSEVVCIFRPIYAEMKKFRYKIPCYPCLDVDFANHNFGVESLEVQNISEKLFFMDNYVIIDFLLYN